MKLTNEFVTSVRKRCAQIVADSPKTAFGASVSESQIVHLLTGSPRSSESSGLTSAQLALAKRESKQIRQRARQEIVSSQLSENVRALLKHCNAQYSLDESGAQTSKSWTRKSAVMLTAITDERSTKTTSTKSTKRTRKSASVAS